MSAKDETTALIRMLVPWWASFLLIWALFGLTQGDRETIQIFFTLLLETGVGGQIVVATGLVLIVFGVWFVYSSLQEQIETQVGYKLATSDKAAKTARVSAYKLIQKKIINDEILTTSQKAEIDAQLAALDPLVSDAIGIVYQTVAVTLGAVIAVLGLMMVLSFRYPSIRSNVFYYFSLVLGIGAATLANNISKSIRKKVVPQLDVYIAMYDTFKVYRSRYTPLKG